MALRPIFLAVFLAELGDKTQLATLLFASDAEVSKVVYFLAASGVLVLSTLIAVLVGGQISQYIYPHASKMRVGLSLVIIGGGFFLTPGIRFLRHMSFNRVHV
jgi:putative Ca2+/H+ antiporter (TMEM165/GDT1 family)